MVKKTIAAIFSVLVLSSVLTACNTTRGVGQDISEGGSAISGAATKDSAIAMNGTTPCRTVNSSPQVARETVSSGSPGAV